MLKYITIGLALGLAPTRAPQPKSHPGACGALEQDAGCYTMPTAEGGALCVCPLPIVVNPGPCPDGDCSV